MTLESDLTKSESEVARFEAELATMRGEASGFALRAYMNSDSGLGGLFSDSAVGNEAAQRQGYATLAMGQSTDFTDELQATTADADSARQVLASQRDRKVKLEADLGTRKEEVDEAIADHTELQAEVRGELQQLVAEERARREAAEAAAARQRAEAAAAQAAAQQAAQAAQAAAPPPPTGRQAVATGTAVGAGTAVGRERRGSGNGADQAAPSGAGSGGGSAGDSAQQADSGPKPGGNVPAPSPGAAGAIEAAMSQLGVGYRFATAIPGVAFDCSGLTKWAWAQAGVGLPHSSKMQYAALPHIPVRPGPPGRPVLLREPHPPRRHVHRWRPDGERHALR